MPPHVHQKYRGTQRSLWREAPDQRDEMGGSGLEEGGTPEPSASAPAAAAWQRAQNERDLLQRGVELYKKVERMTKTRQSSTLTVDLTGDTPPRTQRVPSAPSDGAAEECGPCGVQGGWRRAAVPKGLAIFDSLQGDLDGPSAPAGPGPGTGDGAPSAIAAAATAAARLAREAGRSALSTADKAEDVLRRGRRDVQAHEDEIHQILDQLQEMRLRRTMPADEKNLVPALVSPRPTVELPAGAEGRYRELVSGGDPAEELVAHEGSSITLTRHDMATLAPGAWLNDEVVNLTMALLQERDTAARKQGVLPKTHFFSTFFCNKLYKDGGYNYSQVRRWTTPKRLKAAGQASASLLDCDRIVVPVHQGVHWVLAVVDLKQQELRYLDALKGEDGACLEALAKWIQDEFRDKAKAERTDVLEWKRSYPKKIPQQYNGWDCGMFMLQFADFEGRGEPMHFTQADMGRYRMKAVLDLMALKIS